MAGDFMSMSGHPDRSDGADRNTAEIRADIERTRARLGATVEALGAQLNPSHLAQRAKDTLREATIGKVQHMASNTKARIGETGRGIAETIRENPIPAAMVAAGLGWLLLNRRDTSQPSRFHDGAQIYQDDRVEFDERGSRIRDVASNVAERMHDVKDKAQEAASKVTSSAQQAASKVTSSAQDVAHRVTDGAKEAGQRVSQKAGEVANQVRYRTRMASDRVGNEFEENPLALGGVALALGMAVGMSVPRTRREVEMLGDKRDQLMEKAREQVASTTQKVEGVIERALPEVQAVVKEAAREEGLTR
jgi:ElaB/YqjD/DUF883 family membrane-anchored ribosome-binding protein